MRRRRNLRAIEVVFPRPAPQRSCGKRRFADRIAADLALATIWSSGEARGSTPARSYACPDCAGWHLTSRRTWHPSIPRPRAAS